MYNSKELNKLFYSCRYRLEAQDVAFSTLKPRFESRWGYKNMLSHNLNLKMFLEELVSFFLIGIISIFSVAKIYNLTVLFPKYQTPADIYGGNFLLAFGIGTAIVLGLIRIMHGGCF